MRFFSSLRRTTPIVAALVVAACGEDDLGNDANVGAPIVGDTRADAEHPEVVRIESPTAPGVTATCTGTLIGSRTVLTAKHCLVDALAPTGACPVAVYVDRLGTGTRHPKAERYSATRCDVLDSPTGSKFSHDLGMIRLSTHVLGVAPAVLATSATPSGRYTTYGYGSFGDGPVFGSVCQEHSDGHKRQATYEGSLALSFGQVTCAGDSGGPHFVTGTSVLAGVTSAGIAMVVAVELNADVSASDKWIRDTMRAYGDRPAGGV